MPSGPGACTRIMAGAAAVKILKENMAVDGRRWPRKTPKQQPDDPAAGNSGYEASRVLAEALGIDVR